MKSDPIQPLLRDVKAPRVRKAFARVDRACFVPENLRAEAWSDHPLPLEDQATLSQPSLVARMTEWMDLRSTDRVLEIGTGSGYQTALLAELAAEVATVEYSSILFRTAKARLENLGYGHIRFRNGDGAAGWPEHAPYDRILATVAFPGRPEVLLDQLNPDHGIALFPVGPPLQTQTLVLYKRCGSRISGQHLLSVRFLSLR